MATPTLTVPTETEQLAALGLHRCGHCARILVRGRLCGEGDASWRCRDWLECRQWALSRLQRAAGVMPLPGTPEPAPRLSRIVPPPVDSEPFSGLDLGRCGVCWKRFPTEQLEPVQEELGRAFRCPGCIEQLRAPCPTSPELSQVREAIRVVLKPGTR
jgi:hypothetical protein